MLLQKIEKNVPQRFEESWWCTLDVAGRREDGFRLPWTEAAVKAKRNYKHNKKNNTVLLQKMRDTVPQRYEESW